MNGPLQTCKSPLPCLLLVGGCSTSYVLKLESQVAALKSIINKICKKNEAQTFFELIRIDYASWGPTFWPFLRRPARAPTITAVRGTVAIEGIFGNQKALGRGIRSPYGPLLTV